jgi:hypothetical protein
LTKFEAIEPARMRALGVAVRLLKSAHVDLDDAAAADAYYAAAELLIAAVIATPARDFAGAQVKAETVAWCCASRTEFGLGQTAAERLIGSLLRDLLTRETGTS